jgi:hypothetical protein
MGHFSKGQEKRVGTLKSPSNFAFGDHTFPYNRYLRLRDSDGMMLGNPSSETTSSIVNRWSPYRNRFPIASPSICSVSPLGEITKIELLSNV